MSPAVPEEMFRDLPWPFPGGVFPQQLGAVVQRTVLTGQAPARLVIHDSENGWAVGDGVSDPNEPGALQVTHIAHVIALNSSLTELADLPPGWQAERTGPGQPWARSSHEYPPEDD